VHGVGSMPNVPDGELIIFVGHSQDASAEADAVKALEAEFQRELKARTEFLKPPPFTSVKVWEWNSDAGGRSGGQQELIDPFLEIAHFAVFVFKERVGRETWKELQKCRERQEYRPPVAAVFPAKLPHPERMSDESVAESWADLQRKKRQLTEDFGSPNNTAIRPLDGYNDHDGLKRIVLDQFKRDLKGIINRAIIGADVPQEDVSNQITIPAEIYHEILHISFDRCPLKDYSIDELDQDMVTKLLEQPMVVSELRRSGLSRGSRNQQLSHLGLLYNELPTMGLFLCCARRADIVAKFSCGLKLVVYSEVERANAKPRMDQAKGNLLTLFDEGMRFFEQSSGLTRTGNVGSRYRDDLEIPERALREALVNALIHRDYATVEARGQPTRVEVYPDRVEISSYGGLMDGVSLTAMNEAAETVQAVRRNEVITDIFAYFQHAELNASGIARIHHDVRERDLPKPLIELVEKEKCVKIVLYRPLPEESEYSKIQTQYSSNKSVGRPIVFISSTARDLPEHREQVRLACERAGFAPHEMMENLTTLDGSAVEISLSMVDEADIYLGIFAYRYGYVPEGADISITEMEYNRAVEQKKPRLIFLIDDDHPVTGKDVESGDGALKLQTLKERLKRDRVAAFFKSPGDLRGHVVEALVQLRRELEAGEPEDPKTTAARFHRRTAIPKPPEPYVAHPYTFLQVRDLVGRQAELKLLTDWVAEPRSEASRARILCFVGTGGMGKSAVTWKWFQQIAPEKMKPLAGRLWWSFYESDGSFENLLNRALSYVSGQSEAEVRALPWPQREAKLLQHLNDQPFLLALDGLERILLAYQRMDASYLTDDEYDEQTANRVAGAAGLPPAAAQSFIGQHRLRQTIDPRAGKFLQRLAQVGASRVLISTRLYPSELQTRTGLPYPGCFAYFLRGLSDDDALGLWRALGVSGSRQELVPIFRSVEGHPLLVQALASEVVNYRKAPGDFARWRADHLQFDPTTLPLVQSRTHILHYALAGLDDHVLEVLRTLVAFRMPPIYDTLEALLVGPDNTYPQAQRLDAALGELEDRGLIGWDREANRYYVHPVVRAVVWQQTSSTDQRAIYAALEAHFEPMATPDWTKVESLEDLTPAIERYHTLVGLGRFEDAFLVFLDRLNDATLHRLAAHRERIAWLERLFPEGIEGLPALTDERDESFILNALAHSYQQSGQPGRSVPLVRRGIEIACRSGDKRNELVGRTNLGEGLREVGALRLAAASWSQALILSRKLAETVSEGSSLSGFARTLGTKGDQHLSRLTLGRSINIFAKQGETQSEGVVSAYLAERWLWLGAFPKARVFADRAWELAAVDRSERDVVRAALLQGRAALGLGEPEIADERLHHALTRARAVNLVELEIQALIAIAALARRRDDLAGAEARLDEVWDAAERGLYPLYQADAFNLTAEIARAEGDKKAAIEAATKAYRAAWCDGPPYAYRWGLEKAKAHLQAFGSPEPEMPPFDESKFEPMPEVEINPKDEYWVDPDALD
jgi:predicted HTH transcriptional regulator